jgi:hypothetical protein
MQQFVRVVSVLGILVLSAYGANPNPKSNPKSDKEKGNEQTLIVITFKDGHQESYAMADIARVEYKGADESAVGPEEFLGKWEAGTGSGAGSFFITLESNGEAGKTLGASHGTWAIVGDEVQISWDDGWHDAIRKAGKKQYEKLAFAPGTTFDNAPNNVTEAWRIKKFKP